MALMRTGIPVTLCLLCLQILASPALRAQEREVNVALAKFGATARASSVFGPGYGAANALDGRWANRETDKWNSASKETPHWLVVDLGQERVLRRIVIRHEGVIAQGAQYNTRDFQVQRGASPNGPWTDLVPPIRGNTADVTEHRFAPVRVRYLRLFITQGEQGANEYARIFEFEAYSRVSDLSEPLVALDAPAVYRATAAGVEQKIIAQIIAPADWTHAPAWVEFAGAARAPLGPPDADGRRLAWASAPPSVQEVAADVVLTAPSGARSSVRRRVELASPGSELGAPVFPPFFANGVVHLLSSSHQDIAWMDTPQRCIEQRDRQVITPALDKMRSDPDFRFGMEDTLSLLEYLERHPERRGEVLERTREHRFEWGATFNQPYEGLESGESLVRQLYYGKRLVRKLLPGCDARAAWNCDVPARAAQMPQILAKSGVPYLVLSRHAPGIFRWNSPDGSGVTAFSPGHYGDAWGRLHADPPTVAANIAADLAQWAGTYQEEALKPHFGYVVSVDSCGPEDFSRLRSLWPRWEGSERPAANPFPALISSTAEAFLDAATAGQPKLPAITGEVPNTWLYIHGPTHHWLVSAMREAAMLLPAAETFSAALCLLDGSFASYPKAALDEAWMAEIYPDHGWGGYYGEITDEVFRRKVTRARDRASSLLNRAVSSLARRVRTRPALGIPVVVFNALSWKRTDPVTVRLAFGPGRARGVRIVDGRGASVPCQILTSQSNRDGTLRSATVVFIARDVPSMGYSTWYARPIPTADRPRRTPADPVASVETTRYRIELAPGGIRSIRDKARNRELLNTGKFLGGELFTMQSVGNGAGEFAQVQQPTMEEFDKLSNHRPTWQIVEAGPVRIVAEMRHGQEEAGFRHVTVRQRLIAYRELARIDFETDLIGWDGTPYREFRLAFPIDAKGARITYEAPMAAIEVGKGEIAGAAGERYTQICAEARPREVQNWIDASDASGGVTVSSSVSVWDWQDPTPGRVDYPVLQPVLLASRRSCHGLGNYYLQTGNHSYRFSLFSHDGDARRGSRLGVAANSPLIAVTPTQPDRRKDLPESRSFFEGSAADVVLTTVKKAEDEDGIVIRCCEMDGENARTRITSFTPFDRARRATMIEDPKEPLAVEGGAVELAIGHHAIETVLLTPRKPGGVQTTGGRASAAPKISVRSSR